MLRRFKTILSVVAVAGLVHGPAQAGDAACQLEFLPAAAGGSSVRLEQLAKMDSSAACSAIGGLEFRLDVLPGQLQRIGRDDVEAALAMHPSIAARPEWRGQRRFILVRVRGIAVDGDALQRQAQASLEQWLGRSSYSEFKIAPAARGRVTALLLEGESASIRPFAGPIARRSVVWVDIGRAGQPPRTSYPLWFEVEAWGSVPVATIDVPAGAQVASDKEKPERMDVASLDGKELVSPDQLQGLVALAPIHRGDALTRDRFRVADEVEAGQDVRLQIRAGTLEIQTRGVALEGGADGQRVRVRNASSGEVLVAEVAGKGLLRVLP